jgi:hypothetical protein
VHTPKTPIFFAMLNDAHLQLCAVSMLRLITSVTLRNNEELSVYLEGDVASHCALEVRQIVVFITTSISDCYNCYNHTHTLVLTHFFLHFPLRLSRYTRMPTTFT